jgi:hypothetical protein
MAKPDWIKGMEQAATKALAEVLQEMDIDICPDCTSAMKGITCPFCDAEYEAEIKETEYQTKKRRGKNEYITRNNK